MKGVCPHVVLLAMIADPTRVFIPNDSELSLIRSRAGKKRGRPHVGLLDKLTATVWMRGGRSQRIDNQRRRLCCGMVNCLTLTKRVR